jgi:hypothetical protein
MIKLDIDQAMYFLNKLDPKSRHTIASEAPFGGSNNGPRWESGATYEFHQLELLIADIKKRQARKSNVYYSVNRPCKVSERQGAGGKNNIDDIVCIRALAFDIDFSSFKRDHEKVLIFITDKFNNESQPSMVINTGGGFHLIYFLSKRIKTYIHRQETTEEIKNSNKISIYNRSMITNLAYSFEHFLRHMFEEAFGKELKVDNMSNIDRVMRLPGTVNYPKAEKIAKGQSEALAYIAIDNNRKCDIQLLSISLPEIKSLRPSVQKQPFIPRKKSKWTAYMKALACCEFIRDNHLADANEWYTHNVMLPLIGAIHSENEANQLTIEEATECFMEAIVGGERYGSMGRGQGYFMRQWKSHRPEFPSRKGGKDLGGLIYAAQQNGMQLPWLDKVSLDTYDFMEEKISFEDKELFD